MPLPRSRASAISCSSPTVVLVMISFRISSSGMSCDEAKALRASGTFPCDRLFQVA